MVWLPPEEGGLQEEGKGEKVPFSFLTTMKLMESEVKLIGLTRVSSGEGTLHSPSSQTSLGSVRIALEKPTAQAFS